MTAAASEALRRCRRCAELLPLSAFWLRKNGTPQAYCVPCRTSYLAEWRARTAWRDGGAQEASRETKLRSWLQCSLDKHHEAAPGPIPSLTCVRCGSLLTTVAHGLWPLKLSMWRAAP